VPPLSVTCICSTVSFFVLLPGLSNYEVARYLLTHGLPEYFDGVVFLDQKDRKMILMRQGMNVVRLNQSGIPPDRRFSFYDQIHTTGMDIHQSIDARAVLTLGKDMTFRDYAQGAFRMRGIGKGQTVELFIIPEVLRLVNDQMARVNGPVINPIQAAAALAIQPQGGYGADLPNANPLQPQSPRSGLALPHGSSRQLLVNVAAWLTVNGMKSENMQFRMLCHQSIDNVSRKRAYAILTTHYRELTQIAFSGRAKEFASKVLPKDGASDIDGDLEIDLKNKDLFADDNEVIRTVVQAGSVGANQNAMIGIEKIQLCLDILAERLDFNVPNSLPIPAALSDTLRNSVMRRKDFIKNDYDKAVVDKILMVLVNSEGLVRKKFGAASVEEEAEDDQDANIQKEQVSEEEVLKEQVSLPTGLSLTPNVSFVSQPNSLQISGRRGGRRGRRGGGGRRGRSGPRVREKEEVFSGWGAPCPLASGVAFQNYQARRPRL
jgi:hypothetical protein